MIAEIVSVGTELLMGQVANTDAQHIAKHLAPLGYICYYQDTVGDNVERLTEVVRTALDRSDIVFFTGGLGPTDDDLTKETVAAALGLTCVPIPEEVEKIKYYFESRGREMTPNNVKQGYFPENAIILKNDYGTAPGCIMEANGKAAVLLPGPPRELFPMFDNEVIPYLEKRSNTHLYSKELKFFGIGESQLTYDIRELIENQTNPTIASYVKTGECMLRLTAKCESNEEGEALIRPIEEKIKAIDGYYMFSDKGESLAEVCYRLLKEKGKTLAVAESCTGGLVTSSLVDLPGCSDFLLEGLVTYSNESKLERLHVKPETLKMYGAVSDVCAMEMAQGVRQALHADYGVSTTGIAGPDGGSDEKPVGLVYIAVAGPDGTVAQKLTLNGNRERIRTVAVLNALDLLRKNLLK